MSKFEPTERQLLEVMKRIHTLEENEFDAFSDFLNALCRGRLERKEK